MKKYIFFVISIWQFYCLAAEQPISALREPPRKQYEMDIHISFPNESEFYNAWPEIQNFIAQHGGSVQTFNPKDQIRNIAINARKNKLIERITIVNENSEPWQRVYEIMNFDQAKLERYLSGFGDDQFKSSAINSVLKDIDVLLEEFTVQSLAEIPIVQEVAQLLLNCKVRNDANELMSYIDKIKKSK